jgi:hypothetical protein
MTRSSRRALQVVLLLALSGLVSGCAATTVRPWERDLMARKSMRLTPPPMLSAVDDHIYFSKEGSTGGMEAGGGGCGCN